jgi:hypothetical protein
MSFQAASFPTSQRGKNLLSAVRRESSDGILPVWSLPSSPSVSFISNESEEKVRLEDIKIQKEEGTDLPSPVSNPNSEGRPPFSPPNRPTARNSREC